MVINLHPLKLILKFKKKSEWIKVKIVNSISYFIKIFTVKNLNLILMTIN